MLFNSSEFLFAFLPLTLLLTFGALRWCGHAAGILVLTAASLVFYAWWSAYALLAIGASIAFNYTLAQQIASTVDAWSQRRALFIGVAGNLSALAYFKYANFFIENLAALTGANLPTLNVVLPLAISFYTFQQIAFLVDTSRGEMRQIPFRDYMISVVFFPHLIAGPLLHYRDIIAQFAQRFQVTGATIAAGLPLFVMGLAKKTAIADPIAQFVSPLFAKAQHGPLELVEAWAAALGYTAQLYFDFSGYSDMAIGLGLMFGITLPLNFFSPYKSTSIIEFWRRWHMTLSSFLRDYLYIPLGGSRVGPVRRQVNLMIVMLLGGLWHGAAWTFVFWGALHGASLIVNHTWRSTVGKTFPLLSAALTPLYAVLTFMLVVVGWVFFRSPTFGVALNVLQGMFKPAVVSLPGEVAIYTSAISQSLLTGRGMTFADFVAFWMLTVVAYALIWLAPNAAQIFNLDGRGTPAAGRVMMRSALRAGAVAALVWLAGFGVFSAAPSEFLYFQF